MYLYESHLGGIYATDHELDFDALYCEECGDSDWAIGEADNASEAWRLLKPMTDTEKDGGNGGYRPFYIYSAITSAFGDIEPTPIPDFFSDEDKDTNALLRLKKLED